MESREAVFVDASKRFETKQAMASFDADFNELKVARDAVMEQPARFGEFLESFSPVLKDLLQPYVSRGIETSIMDIKRDEDEQGVRDDDFMICYHESSRDQLQPHMHISPLAIKTVENFLDPFFAGKADEQQAIQQRLETATAAVAWMALGKWAFGKIDPRREGEALEAADSNSLLEHIAQYTGETYTNLDPEQTRKLIEGSLEVFKYRFVGMFAYQGMHLQLESYVQDGRPDIHLLEFFRALCRAAYHAQVDNSNLSVMTYALANPLSPRQAVSTLDVLMGINE